MLAEPSRFVIGVAASAGGLEAISQLVQNVPRETGASYVVAQHMSPTHKSLMATLISRETALPVVELSEDTAPLPDTIYVTPPNSDVVMEGGLLRLKEPPVMIGLPKPSADRLLKSLAAEMGEHAMGIILSGTGSDGSYGIQAIREAGGITIVQDPASAKYDGMPASAIETGCVDLTMSPAQMGQHLAKILSNSRDFSQFQTLTEAPGKLAELLQILLARTQVNFRDYKESTLQRRIQRRMVALAIDDYEDYVAHCRTSATEVDALFKDLLISVTRFFRDQPQFQRLAEAIADLVERKAGAPIRVWVAGCATGEEAYTIAALIAEALGGPEKMSGDQVQIFATDIDSAALSVARSGIYPDTAALDIPTRLMERYFETRGSRLVVKPVLKNVVLFSNHNVIQDPPFINVDLVSLRNVLIYFNAKLQERVLSRVYYALVSDGLLFLGTSESVGPNQGDFEAVSDQGRLFRRRWIKSTASTGRNEALHREISQWSGPRVERPAAGMPDVSREMFDGLVRAVASNALLVAPSQEILRVYGDISPFVQLREDTRLNLKLSLLRPPLRDEAPTLCAIALRRGQMRAGMPHQIRGDGFNEVQLRVYPIALNRNSEQYLVLAFETRQVDRKAARAAKGLDSEHSDYIRQLESDVASTREALQQSIEALQTSNEELQSINEEMQSTNEELQATNEELETSNEELQSTNEELITVNEELQVNSAELGMVTRDLESILHNAPSAILVVDNALQITRASDTARDLFRIPAGADRMHLSQVFAPQGFPTLPLIANEALRLRSVQTRQFESGDHLTALRCAPFFDEAGDLRGVTMIFSQIDVDQLSVKSEFSAKMAMVDRMDEIGHFKVDLVHGKLHWSDRVFEIHGMSSDLPAPSLAEAIGFYHPDDRPKVETRLREAMQSGAPFQFRLRLRRADGGLALVESHGMPMFDHQGTCTAVIGVFRDLTDKRAQATLLDQIEEAQEEAGLIFFSYDVLREALAYRGPVPSGKRAPARLEDLVALVDPVSRGALEDGLSGAIEEGKPFALPVTLRAGPGRCVLHARAAKGERGEVTFVYGMILPIGKGAVQKAGKTPVKSA